jgi:hypothetical protein
MSIPSQIGNVVLTLDSTNIEDHLIKKFSIGWEDQDRPGFIIPLNISIELRNKDGWVDSILTGSNWNNKYLTINPPVYPDMSFLVDSRTVEYNRIEKTVSFNCFSPILTNYKNERLSTYFSGNFERQTVSSLIVALGDSSGGYFPTDQFTHPVHGDFDFGDVRFKYYSSGVDYSDFIANKITSEFINELCQFFGAMFFSYNGTFFQHKTWYGWYGVPDTIAITLLNKKLQNLVMENYLDGIRYNEVISDVFVFTVSGVSTAPVPGDVYSNNSSNFTIRDVQLSSGAGSLIADRTSGSNDPAASGNLTRVSGSGDDPIAFSAWTDTWSWTESQGTITGETVNDLTVLQEFNLVADFGSIQNVWVKDIIIAQIFDDIYNYYIRKDKIFYKTQCKEFIPPGRKVSIDSTEYLVMKAENHIFDFYTELTVLEL